MYLILLSGGAGRRLWPLSVKGRPKQFLKLLPGPQGPRSMAQRVYAQLQGAGLAEKSVVCAGRAQRRLLRRQLGPVRVAWEPQGRDTFPAVALSCAYLTDVLGAGEGEEVVVIPVDPYVEADYFEALKRLPMLLKESGAQVVLMGKRPTAALTQYGYILPAGDDGVPAGGIRVAGFEEKPAPERARTLLGQGALWNMGVFCFSLGQMRRWLSPWGLEPNYRALRRDYAKLPKRSFDRQVLEGARNLTALRFEGLWRDLGTWDQLSQILPPATGPCRADDCPGAFLYNTLDLPLVAAGVPGVIVVASPQGIYVSALTGGQGNPPAGVLPCGGNEGDDRLGGEGEGWPLGPEGPPGRPS